MVMVPAGGAPSGTTLPATQTVDYTSLLKALGAAPNYSGLGKQATSQARAETQSTIAAIRAQQDFDRQQAALRAQQLDQASLASARYLASLNLAGKIGQSYRGAAQDQAALAQGFSGQARQIADAQAAKVNEGLSQLGAPGQAQSTGAPGADVLYALGGQIPASTLLAYGPAAQAVAAAQPAQLRAAGTQYVASALGKGADQAAALDPQIAAAVGKLPALTRSILSDLTSQAQKARQDSIANTFKALQLQQQGLDAEATRAWRQAQIDQDTAAAAERAAHDQALEGIAATNARTSAFNANTSRINATKPQVNGSVAGGIYEYDPATRQIRVVSQPRPTPSKPEIRSVPGGGIVRVNPDGSVDTLRKPNKSAASKAGQPTLKERQTYIGEINDTVDALKKGVPEHTDSSGNDIPAVPSYGLRDALLYMQQHGYFASPFLTKQTLKALHRIYPQAEWDIVAGKTAGPAVPTINPVAA